MKKDIRDHEIENLLSSCRVVPGRSLEDRILQDARSLPTSDQKMPAVRPTWHKTMALLAACLILMFSSFFTVTTLAYEDYMQVYIDVNPSVALSLNRFGKVVDFFCINEDAEKLFRGKSYKGARAEDAMEEIMTTLNEAAYLNNAEMLITAYCKNEKQALKMQDKLENKANQVKDNQNYALTICHGSFTKEEKEEAKLSGISPAKYHLIREIVAHDNSYTLEELAGWSVKQLKHLLERLLTGKFH